MPNNFTGRPRADLNGTDDNSGRINVDVLRNITGFNPLIFLITERGPEGTNDLESVGGITAYGADSLRANSPFATHQTELAKTIIPFAPAHIHRVRLPGARRSIFRVSAELATITTPLYLTDSMGNIKYEIDEDGVAVPIIDGYTVGSRVIIHFGTDIYPVEMRDLGKAEIISNFRDGRIEGNVDPSLPEKYLSYVKTFAPVAAAPLGMAAVRAGMTTDEIMNLINPSDAPVLETTDIKFHSTTLFPLFEAEMGYFGKVGDRFGFVLDDLISITNGNVATMWDINNFLYQLRLVEVGVSGTTKIINTASGDRTINVALAETAYSERYNTDYTWVGATASNYADIGLAHHYSGAVDILTSMLIEGYKLTDGTEVEGELAFGDDGMLSKGAINLLGGVNVNNKQYKTLRLQDSIAFGGSAIGGKYPIMGSGGDDGLVFDKEGRPDRLRNLKLYDEEVRRQLENFGDLEDQLLDIPRFPITTLVDTGYSSETKEAMIVAFNRRPDIYSILTTFRVADYTEPEPPPKPTPRRSVFNVVRPPQAYIEDNKDQVIDPKYLSYLIEKTDDPTVTNVTIMIDPAAQSTDLFIDGQRKQIPLGFALSNRDYLAILNIETNAISIGSMVLVDSEGTEQDSYNYNSGSVQNDFRYKVGTQHSWITSVHQDNFTIPDYSGNYLSGKSVFKFDLDFDGEGPTLPNEGELYLRTISHVNVTVTGSYLFVQDEEYIILTEENQSLDAKRFDINISGKDYKNISAQDIVTAVNREGLGTEAKLLKLGFDEGVE